jgi:pimeloyl-ACP methyl ester carboxylesterase
MKLLYIHGANSSGASWNYVRDKIKRDDLVLNYSCSESFYTNLRAMKKQLVKDEWFIIGHSLGGIYGLHLSEYLKDRCRGAVSISSPFGGSQLADVAGLLMPWLTFFHDVGTCSKPVLEAQEIAHKITCEWTHIVTTDGHAAYIPGKNDGVVSITSQMAHTEKMKVVKVQANHYEILLDPRLVKVVSAQLKLHPN